MASISQGEPAVVTVEGRVSETEENVRRRRADGYRGCLVARVPEADFWIARDRLVLAGADVVVSDAMPSDEVAYWIRAAQAFRRHCPFGDSVAGDLPVTA